MLINSTNITNSNKNEKIKSSSKTNTASSDKTNKLLKLNSGDKISGNVTNLTRDEIKITLPDGNKIMGKILNPEDVKINFEGEFEVTYSENGELNLKLISESKNELQKDLIIDTLKYFGFKASEENLNIVNILLKNQMPLNKEIFLKLNQALKLMGKENTKEALFLLENNLKLNLKTKDDLNNYINQNIKISEQINNFSSDVIDLISNTNNQNIKSQFENILNYKFENINTKEFNENILKLIDSEINNKIPKGELSENILDSKENITNLKNNSNDLINFISENKTDILNLLKNQIINNKFTSFENLFNKIDKNFNQNNLDTDFILNNLFQNNPEIQKKLSQYILNKNENIIKLSQHLTFNFKSLSKEDLNKYINELTEKVNNTKTLISDINTDNSKQILKDINNINDNINFMSYIKNNLYMQIPIEVNNYLLNTQLFVFKDKKNKKASNSNSASALLSLDLIYLGHFEAYIQKHKKNISCQFRIENEFVQKIIYSNIEKLYTGLKKHNYNLEQFTFKQINEPFTLVDKEPITQNNNSDNNEIKNFSFDMRT